LYNFYTTLTTIEYVRLKYKKTDSMVSLKQIVGVVQKLCQ
jgi:hypothetical protein